MADSGTFAAGAIQHLRLTTFVVTECDECGAEQERHDHVHLRRRPRAGNGFTWGDTGNGGVAPAPGGSSTVGNGSSSPSVAQVDPAKYVTSAVSVLTNAPGTYTSQSYAIDKLDRIYATGETAPTPRR